MIAYERLYSSNEAFSRSVTTPVVQRDHSAFFRHRVMISRPPVGWWDKLQVRLNELTALPRGWDGYDGMPVSYVCASFAANVLERVFIEALPMPSLVPGSDGTLQLEWHINDYDIEVDVLDANKVVATRYDCRDGSEVEAHLTNDFKLVSDWIHQLVARQQVAAAAA